MFISKASDSIWWPTPSWCAKIHVYNRTDRHSVNVCVRVREKCSLEMLLFYVYFILLACYFSFINTKTTIIIVRKLCSRNLRTFRGWSLNKSMLVIGQWCLHMEPLDTQQVPKVPETWGFIYDSPKLCKSDGKNNSSMIHRHHVCQTLTSASGQVSWILICET